jgi:hypothetical protein
MKSVYIAGPMTGYPEFNFPAFFKAQALFEKNGWKVFNPAAKDEEAKVHEMEAFKTGDAAASIKEGFDYKAAFSWDCEKVINGDGIFMLKGWEKSTGARAEWAVAQFIKANNPDYEIMYEQ